jgi:hypothetical protein
MLKFSWWSGRSSKFCGLLIHQRRDDRAVGSGGFLFLRLLLFHASDRWNMTCVVLVTAETWLVWCCRVYVPGTDCAFWRECMTRGNFWPTTPRSWSWTLCSGRGNGAAGTSSPTRWVSHRHTHKAISVAKPHATRACAHSEVKFRPFCTASLHHTPDKFAPWHVVGTDGPT